MALIDFGDKFEPLLGDRSMCTRNVVFQKDWPLVRGYKS